MRVLDLKKSSLKNSVCGDVRDESTLAPLLRDIDCVFHFAANVSVPYCEQHPQESYDNNFTATVKVAQCLKKVNRRNAKMVFASSAAVYGNTGKERVSIREEEISAPLSHYAAQKIESENALRAISRESGLPVINFRFFNVYGEGQDPHSPYSGVISIFLDKVRANAPLTIYGDGSNTRDFVSVTDLVHACVAALDASNEACNGEAINVGSGRALSISEAAEKMKSLCGSSSQIFFKEARTGDVKHSLANISRAQNVLNWRPAVSFEEGMRELIQNG